MLVAIHSETRQPSKILHMLANVLSVGIVLTPTPLLSHHSAKGFSPKLIDHSHSELAP